MAEEVIGSGFSDSVKKQFLAREKLFNSKLRIDDQLLYMNSNGAWARLVSSVNTLTAEEVKQLAAFEVGPKDIEGSKNLAYNNVLLGGTRKQQNNVENTKLKGGINYSKGFTPININDDLTVTEGQLRENLYSNYNSLGFRPTPGIESVSIESKNTYGTLREAKIKIVAWTLEDLEVIQALYLRPGYSMLLEWGHSMYIDNDGNLNKNGVGTLYNGFLNNKKQTGRRIEKDLLKKREENFNNYDAMYGIVKNFNWSFRQDGGYDCEVTLISKGSILESMSIMFDASQTLNTEQEQDKQADTKERNSPFHKFFTDLAKIKEEQFDKSHLLKEEITEKGNYTLLDDFNAFRISLKTENGIEELEDRGQFITLKTLLDFYNKYVSPVDKTKDDELGIGKYKLLKYYTGQGEELKKPYKKSLKYITTENHFSIDPIKCILPKEFKNPLGVVFKQYASSRQAREALDLSKVNELKKQISNKIVIGESDDILNIFISNHFLSVTLDSISNSEDKTQHNMHTFVKRILDSMNDVLGGVNDFDQFYDESDDLWYIVDRKVTPVKEVFQNHTTLNLIGLKSTISDLSITSKISNEIGAQVSIAAQGTGNNYKENVGALLKWNSGLIDRTIPMKTITQKEFDEVNKEEQTRLEGQIKKNIEWAGKVTEVFSEYSTGIFNWNRNYDEEKHNSLKSGHKQYCSKWVEDSYSKDANSPKPAPGVIPVELSFKTIGIGGLKIGQAFKVAPGILPKSYDKNFGYIITGLSHDITGNKWETSIKTQFYSIQNPSEEEIKASTATPVTQGDQNSTTDNLPENTSPDRDWWTLVAICYAENFADNYQGYADVAQSIYNRKRAGYFGGSIVANILGKGQYEPVFKNKADWAKIQDIDTATTAVYNSLQKRGSRLSGQRVKNDLIKCAEVLQNNSFKQEAVRFVGTRTEFLASTPKSSEAVGIVERSPSRLNNSFFWRYEGKTRLYEKNEVAIVYDFKPKTDTV